ncbi:hypothetical protein G7Z17_g754 [Cylindrodendrum hubeiense]|uniref:Uncharacterized protein n=1 Tax=Cylindrodendrum hubeiense TaxID=595255 RepID=A0A9P5HH95_9HYPO|nr:hypothetical protein G7Z17_g754 [Cylindrodendrum hubeiense]
MEKPTMREQGQTSTSLDLLNLFAPFITGCTAGMIATTCVQPIDTIKVRMQLMEQGHGRSSPWTIARSIVAQNGFLNLYQGLSAGLLRQLVYGTLRLGLFSTFEKKLERQAREQGTTVGFGGRAVAGLGAGAIAALVGTPTEVALIRMQADGMSPVKQRKLYTSVLDALARITRQEGVLALWKGTAPNIIRAMSTNFGQLAFFSESKHQIRNHTSLPIQTQTALAACIAGLAGAIISLPFDFVKTRLQNQSLVAPSRGLPLYIGTVHCFSTIIHREGLLRFYRDFWPYFLRVGPQS